MRVEKQPEGIPSDQRIAKAGERALWRPPQLSDLPKTSGIQQAQKGRRRELFVASGLMNAIRRNQKIDPAKLKKLHLPQEVVRVLVHRAGEES